MDLLGGMMGGGGGGSKEFGSSQATASTGNSGSGSSQGDWMPVVLLLGFGVVLALLFREK